MNRHETNQLGWLPHDIAIPECPTGAMLFWRVLIDERERWSEAQPIAANDPILVLSQCTICGQCGCQNTLVRRAGRNHIVWFGTDLEGFGTRELAPGEALVFERSAYECALGHGNTSTLPEFSNAEIRSELRSQRIPDPRDGLYRDPDSVADDMGRKILALSRDIVEGPEKLFVCDPPVQFTEVRVGLEQPGVPEAVWRVGAIDERTCLQFVAHPRLPVWVTAVWSDVIQDGFREAGL